MLRPGGFPEYTPQEQKVFDTLQDIIRTHFEQRNFQHIWTPAVEKNEILLKGGETVANEIFGLGGLKNQQILQEYIAGLDNNQNMDAHNTKFLINTLKKTISADGTKDKEEQIMNGGVNNDPLFNNVPKGSVFKDYSLHFDLTVPFARYVLDHKQELTFPFKRYQMQPVRRGERQQRGRFKEFRQCDVDCIWPSGTKVGSWYGCETIATLQAALHAICLHFQVEKTFTSHVSHIGLTKAFLHKELGGDEMKIKAVVELLDKYYKKSPEVFVEELTHLVGNSLSNRIVEIIETKNIKGLASYDAEAYNQLKETLDRLPQIGASVTYDFTIVRGLGYYTDIVFETFFDEEMSLGSVCSGGGYEEFTKFIDPKQVFSGIGGSIGLSRLMEIMVEASSTKDADETYMLINFTETFPDILTVYTKLLAAGKTAELYPTAAKLGKQFEYADKKGITHVVIIGSDELARGVYKIKDLRTGEESEISLSN